MKTKPKTPWPDRDFWDFLRGAPQVDAFGNVFNNCTADLSELDEAIQTVSADESVPKYPVKFDVCDHPVHHQYQLPPGPKARIAFECGDCGRRVWVLPHDPTQSRTANPGDKDWKFP